MDFQIVFVFTLDRHCSKYIAYNNTLKREPWGAYEVTLIEPIFPTLKANVLALIGVTENLRSIE